MGWGGIGVAGWRCHGEGVAGRTGASRGPDGEPKVKEASDAKTANDRIVIPPEVLRIAEMASPRSSLIISDEELSPETGKGTDFVVLLSGEPQGGIAGRRYRPAGGVWDQRPRPRLPFFFR